MNRNTKAIIPIAGWGTRLRPHTYSLPKVLMMVAGKPMIGHVLDRIQALGIKEIIIVEGHLGEMVRDYVKSNYSFKTHFIKQKQLLGLGHAIYLTKKVVNNSPVFIVLGDTIIDGNFSQMIQAQQSFLGVKKVEDPRRFGVVTLKGKYITGLVEKPDTPISHLAIVGVYYLTNSKLLYQCLEHNIQKGKTTKGEIQLTDALALMINKKEKITTVTIDGWYDCGTVNTILKTNTVLLKKLRPEIPDKKGVVFIPPVSVAKNATVQASVIGPNVTIADNVTIKRSIIRDSIIHENAEITNALLQESLIGKNAKVAGEFRSLNVGDDSLVEY